MDGGDRVTSRDIARAAGVSQPTVSRALRGDPRVAAATIARVRGAAERLGYVPHGAARSLVTRRADAVAIVASDLNNPFYPELLQTLHRELGERGLRAVLLTEPGGGADFGQLVRSGVVDGAIVATATDDGENRERLAAASAPVVLVVREVPGLDRDAVVADNLAGGQLAAAEIIAAGHRRIGMISGPLDTSTARLRDEGFAAGLAAAELNLDPELCRRGPYSHDAGHRLAAELLALPSPPTAIFCGNDVLALGALDAAAGLGVAVPEALSIVGFDDILCAGWEAFGLTTVRQPLARMAAEAVALFVDRLAGEAPDGGRRRMHPVEFRRRRTLGPPPG